MIPLMFLKTNAVRHGMNCHDDIDVVEDGFMKIPEKGVYKAELFIEM